MQEQWKPILDSWVRIYSGHRRESVDDRDAKTDPYKLDIHHIQSKETGVDIAHPAVFYLLFVVISTVKEDVSFWIPWGV